MEISYPFGELRVLAKKHQTHYQARFVNRRQYSMKSPKTHPDPLDQKLKTVPIAIIGMSAIFPNSTNKQEYWENILNKIDAIADVPESRWNSDDYYDPNPAAADKTYCKRGGFIPDIDFDPAEFGLPPNLLEATDVSQLLALVAARDCLEDAGYGDSAGASRENTGVILGMVGIGSKLVIPLMARLQYPVWDKVLRSYGIPDEDRAGIIEKIKLAYPKWEENSFPGSIGNVVAGRIANRFNLGSTNCVVDAACASSLAAIRMAVGELIEGRADMMITGGVDTDNSIGAYLCFSKTPAFSKGEHVRSFDKESDGMMVGEGIGMVLLKRLDDAKRDGDKVYAVIKAIGTSSDGRFKSIYAPRPDGQSLALRRAYSEAGFSPATVGLIEAHGTGTMAGDPAEFQGLNAVFSEVDPEKQHIALGSVKSQIGHTKAAAGVASLIKVSLALHNKILPATINVTEPNPKLGIENSPFYLNTEVRPWFRPADAPRRAGVSSFGFGGTNFHVVLEENEADHTKAYRTQSTAKMILLSAANPEALLQECQTWSAKLSSSTGKQALNELVKSTSTKNIPLDHSRVGFVAADAKEALSKLATAVELVQSKGSEEASEHPSGVYYRKQGINPDGKLVALFPGQGSQYLNMGAELALNFPEIRQTFTEMDVLFAKNEQPTLTSSVYPIPVFDTASRDIQAKKITQTEFAQPAIGTLSAGLFRMLQQAGFKPDFTAGHSFGELSALWAAGVFSDEDFFFLAKSRGKAMAPLADPNFDAGTMLAVKGDAEKVRAELTAYPEVTLANWNSNSQVVLAGSKPAIANIQKVLAEKGYSVVPLDVSAAFHTPLVGHAQKPFAAAIQKVQIKKPEIKVFSNSTGELYSSESSQIQQTLEAHILKPVRFKDEIEAIYADGGSIFVEVGPKNVLTNLVNNILEGKPHFAVALNPNAKKDSDRQYREAVTQLCVLGLGLQNYDPYSLPEKDGPVSQKSAISVKLNGGLYLSEKTRTAFNNAIHENNSLHLSPEKQSEIRQPQENPVHKTVSIESRMDNSNMTNISPTSFSQVEQLQKDIIRVHEKFLENDADYTEKFGRLTEQELNLVSANASPASLEQINVALQTLDRSLTQFHLHQAETTRIHEQYLQNQHNLLSQLLGASQKSGQPESAIVLQHTLSTKPATYAVIEPVPVLSSSEVVGGNGKNNGHHVDAPAEKVAVQPARQKTAGPVIGQVELNAALLKIVSEKTGYPTEMLELTMDMEADLGIDSIKRVEILGGMQEVFPDLPKVEPTALAELHTLGQIVEYMSASAGQDASLPANEPVEKPAVTVSNTPAAQVSSSVPLQQVSDALLAVVSEKTGYPTEMLELGMDMEADLGIDSIKRVEILGAMQEKFPELPKADAASLSEMHTLQQIIDALAGQNASPMDVQSPAPAATKDEILPLQDLSRGYVSLKSIPLPDRISVEIPVDHVTVLTNDGSELTNTLAKNLMALNHHVVVLSLAETSALTKSALPEGVQHIKAADTSEEALQTVVQDIQARFGHIATFIHLDPANTGKSDFAEHEKAVVKSIFLLAKTLKTDLSDAAAKGFSAFMTVTHLDGQFGLSMTQATEPISGGLFGLTKTLNLEWDDVFCRAVDLQPKMPVEKAADIIVAELYDPNKLIAETAYSEAGRFTMVVDLPEVEGIS
jgi:acyl transferase domain-containing protein/acyl carrier protein